MSYNIPKTNTVTYNMFISLLTFISLDCTVREAFILKEYETIKIYAWAHGIEIFNSLPLHWLFLRKDEGNMPFNRFSWGMWMATVILLGRGI